MNLALLMLLLYTVALIALGLWIGRRVSSTSSFFVAGRQLGPGLLFATLLAANIGAGSTVGAAGLGFRDGLSAWWWVGSAGFGTLLLAFWIGPRIWRLARQHDLQTVGDFLELRFGATVRGLVAALLWLGTLAILAGQIIAMASILEAVAGVPRPAGAVLGGVVMTVYFAAGGLLTSVWVNLVQLVVLLLGFAIALPLALGRVGGVDGLLSLAPAGHDALVSASGWQYLVLLVPAFIVSPGLLQKIYGARDERAVRVGVAWSGVALLIFAAFPALLGMSARALHPELAHHELALPTLLANDLPLAVGMLGLAAVLSAELSSADALLFMLATSLSRDLYARFLRPQASDRQILRVARGAAIAGGAAAVLLALLLPSVIGALTIFYACLGVSLLVPVLAGLFSRAGRSSVLAAIICGILALLGRHIAGPTAGFWTPSLVGLTVSGLAFASFHGWQRLRTATR